MFCIGNYLEPRKTDGRVYKPHFSVNYFSTQGHVSASGLTNAWAQGVPP